MEILAGSLLTPETVNATDYPITETDLKYITKRDERKHVQLHQLDLAPYGNVSCFYAAAFKIVADAYPLTDDEKKLAVQAWKDGWAAIVKDGKVEPGLGGRLADGVDYARRAWNAAFPAKKVKTYRGLLPRFDKDSSLHIHFYRAMNNGWAVMFGGYIGQDFWGDMLDGTINNDQMPTGKIYGHARTMFDYVPVGDAGGNVMVFDNYPKTWDRSAYRLDDMETKVKNGVLFPSYFLALPA